MATKEAAEEVIRLYDRERHRDHAYYFGGHDSRVCARSFYAITFWGLGFPDQAARMVRRCIEDARALGHTFSHAIVRLLQAPASGIQAYCIDRLGRCPAALVCVLPGEVAGTHVNVLGQAFYRQIGIQILRHPTVKVGEDVRIGLGLSCKQRAVLRLASGALEIDDKHAGDIDRHSAPTILLD